MFVDELPRNATGKVLKRELPERDEGEAEGVAQAEQAEEAPAS